MNFERIPRVVSGVLLCFLLALTLSACGGLSQSSGTVQRTQSAESVAQQSPPTPEPTATPTATSTPEPTATPTPEPTATPTDTAVVAAAAGEYRRAEADISVPEGWKVLTDDRLEYTFAIPATWLVFDLRSDNIENLAGLLGGAGAVEQVEAFLTSPAGEGVGLVAVEPDVTQFFAANPFPTVANVSVAYLPPDFTQDSAVDLVTRAIEALGDAELTTMEQGLVNNLPGIQATGRVDLSQQGMNVQLHVEVTTLFVEDRAYILTLATKEANAGGKATLLEQIPGSFAPIP